MPIFRSTQKITCVVCVCPHTQQNSTHCFKRQPLFPCNRRSQPSSAVCKACCRLKILVPLSKELLLSVMQVSAASKRPMQVSLSCVHYITALAVLKGAPLAHPYPSSCSCTLT
jgi:hypothetical protein